jgi:nicotinamidase-related amidase
MATTGNVIDPGRAALLVMDFQNAMVANVADSDALLARAATALATARESGMTVGYVRVAFTDADYEAIPATNKSFSALSSARRLHDDAPETAIHEAVAPAAGDIIVRKTRVGAFSTTDLEQQLRARDIDTLLLAGIATSGVVLSTVRAAADRDFRLYVIEDACADADPQVHEVLTQKVFVRQADVITVADLPALIGG